jgi:hypothetical protein
MRFFTSFAVGLPLLAVSAVVAYPSIQGISRQVVALSAVDTSPAAAPTSDRQITPQAVAFAGAGLSGWTVPERDRAQVVRPQSAAPVAQTVQLLGVDISAPIVPKPRPAAPLSAAKRDNATPDIVIASEPVVIVTEKPVASAAPSVSLPAAKPAATRSLKPAPKSFRMPWQTGVFQ